MINNRSNSEDINKDYFIDFRYKDDEADLKMHCNLTIKGMYKANGRILIVAINGDGNAKIKISEYNLIKVYQLLYFGYNVHR